ncbi:SMI1/KNR4 family protein [Amycolatopsis sp. NEAU-NG30]|uniref:SMI1/KNR4 family protein n=1 Tax=Amycolatopsis melonis TaxID=3156488 RepID=A0ABV0LT57_9PSEU
MTAVDAGYGEIARAMAGALHAGAGAGWTAATLQLRHTGGAVTCRAWSDVHEHLTVDFVPIAMSLGGKPPSALEVRLTADGGYTFTARPDVAAVSPGMLVFDAGFRYPGHPRPGLPRPAGTEPTTAPTDPAVLAEVTGLASEFAGLYTAIKGTPPPWPAGRTEAEVAAAEARIGVRLPEDLRALYLVADGDPAESGLLGPYSHHGLDQLVADYLEGEPGSYGWEDGLHDDGVVFEPAPFGRMKRLSRNDWWVTFGGDRAMNYLAVDLDPATDGRPGQVFEYGRDIYGPLRLVSGSITDMLTEAVSAVRAGKYEDPGGTYLSPETGLRGGDERSYHEIVSKAAEVDLAEAVAGVVAPELVQLLYVNDAADVNLAVFEPLGSLRQLSINRARSVTPSIAGLPELESLQIEAGQVDLAALAGHPALWDLELTRVGSPVEVAVLATLPRLLRLNLEGSAVRDWGEVCALPGLKVLRVDAQQIPELLACGKPLPPLAALFVSGQTTLRQMSELRTAFGHGDADGEVVEISGTLT